MFFVFINKVKYFLDIDIRNQIFFRLFYLVRYLLGLIFSSKVSFRFSNALIEYLLSFLIYALLLSKIYFYLPNSINSYFYLIGSNF